MYNAYPLDQLLLDQCAQSDQRGPEFREAPDSLQPQGPQVLAWMGWEAERALASPP